MKKLLLSLFIFVSFAAKAQTYFTKPGIPPGSISKSFTGRIVTNAVDSLTELWLGVDGNKFWKVDLAAQTRAYFDPLVFTGPGTLGNPVTQDTIKKLIVFNPGIASVSGINNMSLSALSLNLQNTNFLFGVSPNHLEFINKGDTSQHYLDFNVSGTDTLRVRNDIPWAFKNQAVIYKTPAARDSSYNIANTKYVDRAVMLNSPSSPNAVIAGLSMQILIDNVTLEVAGGFWRIGNNIYSRIPPTDFTTSTPDATLYRYESVYATKGDTLGIAVGALNAIPVPPSIPDSTVLVGTILITPTGPTVIYPAAGTIYTKSDTLTSSRTVNGYHNKGLSFNMFNNGGGSTLLTFNPTAGFDLFTQLVTNGSSSELYSDASGYQITHTSSIADGNKQNVINFSAYSASGKGISIQLDHDSLFTYQNTNYETRLRNYGLGTGIPDMNILRSIADSVKGTILPDTTGQIGKVLGYNGSSVLWVEAPNAQNADSLGHQAPSFYLPLAQADQLIQTGRVITINGSGNLSTIVDTAKQFLISTNSNPSTGTHYSSFLFTGDENTLRSYSPSGYISLIGTSPGTLGNPTYANMQIDNGGSGYNKTWIRIGSFYSGIAIRDNNYKVGMHADSDYSVNIRLHPNAYTTSKAVKLLADSVKGTIGNIYTIDGTIPTSTARTVTIPTGAQLILAANDGGTNFSTSTFAPSGIILNALGAGAAQVELNGTHAQFQYNQGGLENITFDASGEIIHDALNNIGLQYDSSVDSSQFKLNPLSLPDSKWVLNRIASYPHGTGTVTAVTGTPSRITSTGGTTPAIDISSTFEALLQKTANFVDSVTPTGAINGSNVTYTLPDTPTTGSVHLYLNGIRVTTFTMSTNTITWTGTAPSGTDTLLADYRK